MQNMHLRPFAATCAATLLFALLIPSAIAQTPPAFPGAEGFGAMASGGRGGEVYYVTTLNDDGPGSLRDAVSQPDRMVLFKVSGTINLTRRLVVNVPNITIAGQTAPGDGICLRGKELFIADTSNVIVRFLRCRPGDELKQEHDALTVWNAHNVIIDHCSMSWSTDSINDVVKGSGNVTVQWCILSEALDRSVHTKGAHGYATGWDGRNGGGSYHHNLIAHCNSRTPRIEKAGPGVLVDIRNMVIYNPGEGGAYGGEEARFNFLANYFKPGPNTRHPKTIFRISSANSRGYFADNFVEGWPDGTRNNVWGIVFDEGVDRTSVLVDKPFEVAAVTTHSAQQAYELVLAYAGAVLPRRDAVDQRIISDVRNGTGKIIDSQADVGGWPELKSAPSPPDSDGDGMPDQWEQQRGLNPSDPTDGTKIAEGGYSNLELYLNELAAAAFPP